MADQPTHAPNSWLRTHALWLVLLAGFVGFLLVHPPITRMQSHAGRMVLATIAIGLLIAGWRLRRAGADLTWPWRAGATGPRQLATRLLFAGWISAAGYGVFNYYQFDRRVVATVGDYADATYYYLNSKYFDELGYTELYRAMLVADDEGPRRFADVPRYRDLIEYEQELPRATAIAASAEIKARFSPARWNAFKRDLEAITSHQAAGGWRYFFIDHGYNPPPSWTLVGGTLARATPVEDLKRITAVDMALVVALFLAIGLVMGWPTLLCTLLFFSVTFSGRWPILGQSILRFDWLVAVVGAVLALKKERHGLAGGLLTYAALTRVFPAIFALPYVVVMIRDAIRARGLPGEHKRFVAGAAVVLVLLGGGALVQQGPEAYRDAAANLKMHGSPESFSSHRVGLGDALMYRGEWTRADMNERGGIEGKRDLLWQIDPYLKVCGALALLFVGWYAWRSREPVHRLLWLGIYPLFCLTNPQVNYYNLRMLLVLWHMERWHERRHQLGLGMLFAIEVATQAMMVLGATRYAVTATASIGLVVYLVIVAVELVREGRGE